MKPHETKKEYIRLRAEGNSYTAICEQLHIAKGTCVKWERELSAEIGELKRAELAELCESYGISKKARIKKLGDTLAKIDQALDNADFSKVDPAKLLDHKLKYTDALKEEYIGTQPATAIADAKNIVSALNDLLNRARAGELTTEQAQRETNILAQLLKAYDTVELQTKLNELEIIIGGLDNGNKHRGTA